MDNPAIVLAAFGASQPEALEGILSVKRKAQEVFPNNKLVLSFTSNMLRRIWQKRNQDPAWKKQNSEIPQEILEVQGVLGSIASLQDKGYRNIIVQPLHIYAGEEFSDLKSYIAGLNAITTVKEKGQPFDCLALGRPALGEPGPVFPYQEDIEHAVSILHEDVKMAQEKDAALVYLGHGNEYFPTGIYREFEEAMQLRYQDATILVGTVEGAMSLKGVISQLKEKNIKKVFLKPLMLVAGEHARADMAGPEDDSWKSLLEGLGFEVFCCLKGLGEIEAWAQIYMDHIKDVAKTKGLDLG